MLQRVKKVYRRWFSKWLEKRIPAEKNCVLNNRRIFIIPSKSGFTYLAVVALLWLVAINYENNLIIGFASLLLSLFVIAIFHSYANLSGLVLSISHIDPTFAGKKAHVVLLVGQKKQRLRDNISLSFPTSVATTCALTEEEIPVSLYVNAPLRGWFSPGRLSVESHYPMGLFRVWTHVLLTSDGVIYPRPIKGFPHQIADTGRQEKGEGKKSGSEDFIGLEKYQRGESLNRISWKQLARGRGLMSKHFADPPVSTQWLEWNAFAGMDREARLSRLCYCLIEESKGNHPYGLRLPGFESVMDSGPRHLQRLLYQLAIFEAAGPKK